MLGLVLGALLDKSLPRGVVLSDGNLAPFFKRPIRMALAGTTLFAMPIHVPASNQRLRGGYRAVRQAVTGHKVYPEAASALRSCL